MRYIADLHIHSPYSRAVSKNMTLEEINIWSKIKGLTIVGTGDFTHPEWFKIINEKLELQSNGFLSLKSKYKPADDMFPEKETYFVLSSEISLIYKKNNKTRKVHLVVIMPDIDSVAKFRNKLNKLGNIKSDGRPILGIDVRKVTELALNINKNSFIFPAHIWTPHFSVLGKFSSFNSIEECFEEFSEYIYAVETGLSSDPPMNWQVESLDNYILISNSDAHSPQNLAREANIFNTKLSYSDMLAAIKTREGFCGTIEFFPQEGKYHYDGHRACKLCLSPAETKKFNGICPKCGKPITIGVLHRVTELATRPENSKPAGACDYISLVPLKEILSEILNVGKQSKTIHKIYMELINTFGSELDILMNVSVELIKTKNPLLSVAIEKLRQKEVSIYPGYDGEYGKIKLLENIDESSFQSQLSLF